MSEVKTCRLCLELCQKYKNLYNKNDHGNQLYEMTYKYLHPTIIDMEQAQHLRVICLRCWRHIRDFHNFKLTVLVVQSQLNEHDTEEVVIKREVEHLMVDDNPFLYTIGTEIITTEEFAEHRPEEVVIRTEAEQDPEEVVFKIEAAHFKADDIPNLYTVRSEIVTPEDTITQEPQLKQEFEITAIRGNYDETSAIKPQKDNISLPELELIDAQSSNAESIYHNNVDDVQKPSSLHIPEETSVEQPKDNHEEINELELIEVISLEPQSEAPSISRKTKPETKQNTKIDNVDALIAKTKPILKCPYRCTLAFAKLSLLRKHILNDHPGRRFFISCCGRRMHASATIEDHFQSQPHRNIFRCDICLEDLKSSDGLKRHLATTGHADLLKPENVCDICGKCFNTNTDLRSHCKAMHGSYYRTRGVLQPDGRTGYTCYKCGDVAYSPAAYRHHRLFGPCPAEVEHICTICNRSFKSLHILRKHLATHNRKIIYSCNSCPRMFTDYGVLCLHRKQEHGYEGEDGAMEDVVMQHVEMDDVAVEVKMKDVAVENMAVDDVAVAENFNGSQVLNI